MDFTDHILFVPMFFLAIYLWLESQDFGVAIAAPMVARNEAERKAALNLLKPGLDGNEAWVFLCAGMTGALFSDGRFNIPENTFLPLGIILVGMIVRLAAAFSGNVFQQSLLLRGIRFITIINVISASILALELVNRDFFTTESILGLIWLLMSCIQIGAIYGACKTVNPLGERFRATFLVTNILSLILFIVAFGAWYVLGGPEEMSAAGILLAGFSFVVIISAVSFFAVRARHVYAGMLLAYMAQWGAMCIYIVTMIAGIPSMAPNTVVVKGDMGEWIIGFAAVWTGIVFIWRICRHKVKYIWEDHI